MSNETKLERQIRRWNKFFALFGLRGANLQDESVRVIVKEPIIIVVIMFALNIIQFSRRDAALTVLDEDGIVRYIHMFGNFIVILEISLTARKIKQCSNIQRKFQVFEKYGASNVGGMIGGYLLFPLLNLTFFAAMDIAEYFFLQPEVRSVDVIPVISGHALILYDILHVLHFSVHLSWLRKLIVFLNVEFHEIVTRLSQRFRTSASRTRKTPKTPTCLRLVAVDDRTAETLDLLRDIKLCRHLYNESYELCKDINDTYATRNLIMISFNVFVGIVFLAPAVGDIITVLTSKIDPGVNNEAITAQHIMFHCKWSVTCFFTVYGLIWASRLTTSQVSRTSSLVYDLLAFRLDRKVKIELQRFAVQILHTKLEFSAHEFFTLNNKLFLSILATFVSYLVVMFQLNV